MDVQVSKGSQLPWMGCKKMTLQLAELHGMALREHGASSHVWRVMSPKGRMQTGQ